MFPSCQSLYFLMSNWVILLVNYQLLLSYLGYLSFTPTGRLLWSLVVEVLDLVSRLCLVYTFILALTSYSLLESTHNEKSAAASLIFLGKARHMVCSHKTGFLLPAWFLTCPSLPRFLRPDPVRFWRWVTGLACRIQISVYLCSAEEDFRSVIRVLNSASGCVYSR